MTMHAVAPSQAAHWAAMGFDELVLTTDIELLRSAFADLIRDARAALGDTDAPAASSLAAYGRPA